jgi:hypothetical protein
MTASGLENLCQMIGKKLTGVRRYVLGLGRANDILGHGITELSFEEAVLVIRPGPNEDYLVVENGPLEADRLDRDYWTEVDLVRQHAWTIQGRLERVQVFTDGAEDVALVFEFDNGEQFSIVLCDTDVAIGRGLERFAGDPHNVRPVLRTTFPAHPLPDNFDVVSKS